MISELAVNLFHDQYKGRPLSLWITGGGFTFLDILKRPGCSKFLHEVIIPYSPESILCFLKERNLVPSEPESFCSSAAAKRYAKYLSLGAISTNPLPMCVAVTAALTTDHYRNGGTRVYMAVIRDPGAEPDVYRLDLYHPDKSCFYDTNFCIECRRREDEIVSLSIMEVIFRNFTLFHSDLNNPLWRRRTKDFATVEKFYYVK